MPRTRSEASRLFGARLRARRLELGCSQYDIAHLSGVDLANYGRLERGGGNPTLTTIVQLAITLSMDPAELVTGLAEDGMLPEVDRPYSALDYIAARRQQEGR
ncbi:helix-turn-helix transcriptional regulator [Leifsonia sp. ZF2019]|uniref:helix-turn-helix domain-containing protein n=1 Tax=Leifsonia sp. ZF2019 TaxID=2781978 RepID=UPI001CBEE99B|nr:helix-turn-helix transcriptional regulator [Leifsonia sp. ZF2019]UAJ78719.1 helix-turn-helix transcriptional regulator [Leifsonia sp. ZF2019]